MVMLSGFCGSVVLGFIPLILGTFKLEQTQTQCLNPNSSFLSLKKEY